MCAGNSRMIRYVIVTIAFISSLSSCVAQTASITAQGTTITEPGIYHVSDFYKVADIVAVVKVLAGDTEGYESAVYKAKIVTALKGGNKGDVIYFGPYIGTRLGWEYVVFLKRDQKKLTPISGAIGAFGVIPYSRIFNEGYSQMEISYECAFPGKAVEENCDYGVRVCTDYVRIPPKTSTSPPMREETPFGCRYVRERDFSAIIYEAKEPDAVHLAPDRIH